jgi:leader peptidase (prepilin peptidase) / N-methyltransferase
MVFLVRREEWLMHAAGAVIGFSVLWAVETGYRQLRRRDGLGRGDAKLLGAIGMWVGAMGLPIVLLIASLSGIAAALIQSWRNAAPIGAATAIAFGPWIALGGFAVWLLQFTAQQFLGY